MTEFERKYVAERIKVIAASIMLARLIAKGTPHIDAYAVKKVFKLLQDKDAKE